MYVPTWLTVTFGTQKCLLRYETKDGIASVHERHLWGTKRSNGRIRYTKGSFVVPSEIRNGIAGTHLQCIIQRPYL